MKKVLTLTMLLSVVFVSCQRETDTKVASPNIEPLAYTVRTEKTELFVEFKPLIVGELSSFVAHFTYMKNFKPVESGSATVSLISGKKGIRQTVDEPSSPGIFRPALKPTTAGKHQLVFEIKSGSLNDRIRINEVEVYENKEAAIAAKEDDQSSDEISYLKEQTWKVDFEIQKIGRKTIHDVIETSGKIESKPGDDFVITAKTDGIVLFTGDALVGNDVKQNQTLFTLSGAGTTDENVEAKFEVARSAYEKAKSDYERGEKLVEDKFISQKEFNQLKMGYEQSESRYKNIAENYSKGGQLIKLPFDGFIKQVMVKEGQFVKIGDPLAVISKSNQLLIQADVSQKYFGAMNEISSANFKTAYDDSVFNMDSLNGRFISHGKSIAGESNYLPVHFEIENAGQLISGSFVSVYLLTNEIENTLVVPHSAIMEDYEHYYVFVQTGGESFEKRDIEIGIDDGINVQILSGVEEGEWVVTKGAYQVKLASMTSEIPAHGHSH